MTFSLFKPFIWFGSYTKTAIKTETGKAIRIFLKLVVHVTRISLSLILGLSLWMIISAAYYAITGAVPESVVDMEEGDPVTLEDILGALQFLASLAVPVWLVYCLLMAPTAWLREKFGLEEEKVKLGDFTKQFDSMVEESLTDVVNP